MPGVRAVCDLGEEASMTHKDKVMREVPVTVWNSCYSDSWKSLIVDAAFAHP